MNLYWKSMALRLWLHGKFLFFSAELRGNSRLESESKKKCKHESSAASHFIVYL